MLGELLTPAPLRPPSMTPENRISRIVPRLLACTWLSLCGCHTGDKAETTAAPETVLLGPESTVTAQVRNISSGPRLAGSLEAKERAAIAAEVGGSVLKLGAELGDEVKRGQVLAKIEAIGSADTVRSARSAVSSAEQAAALAQRQAKRTATLVASGAQAEAQLEVDRNAVALAAAQVQEARARLVVASQSLRDATVVSPMDGVISEQAVHKGDVVSAGTRLFTVIDPSSMRLEASVPSVHLPELAVGAAVHFEIRGRPGETFTGEITRIAPAADPTTRQIPILVSIPNPARRLLAGLFAEGRIASQTSSGVVLPLDAVEFAGSHPTVTAVRDGKARPVEVEVGVRDDTEELVLIASGIRAGETVVRGSLRSIAPGTPIKLIEDPRATPAQRPAPARPATGSEAAAKRPPA
jgi:membrane fusion protein, multidrug efflux system